MREAENDLIFREELEYDDKGVSGSDYSDDGQSSAEVETPEDSVPRYLISQPRCWSGTEKKLNLMMPDR